MDTYGYTYITENKLNGKRYIGQHKGEFDPSYLGSGTIIKHAIRKYGVDSFAVDVIDYHIDKISLDAHERELIAAHNATSSSMFYNIAEGGEGGNTRAGMTDEQYARYCDTLKVAQNDPELLARRSKISKDVYERPGVREKISTHSKSKWEDRDFREQTCKNMSLSKTGKKNHRYGISMSEKTKDKLRSVPRKRWFHDPALQQNVICWPKDAPCGWLPGRGKTSYTTNKHNI